MQVVSFYYPSYKYQHIKDIILVTGYGVAINYKCAAVEICTNSTVIVSLRGLPEDLTFEISDDDKKLLVEKTKVAESSFVAETRVR
jgi:hypothetical protein